MFLSFSTNQRYYKAMSTDKTNVNQLPLVKKVTELNINELITQVLPFGNGSFACLTSQSRVIAPGKGFGEWIELPTPTLHPDTKL